MSDPSTNDRNFPIPPESHPARNSVETPSGEYLAFALVAKDSVPAIADALAAYEDALVALDAAETARAEGYDEYRNAPQAHRAALVAAAASSTGKPPKSPDLDALSDAAIFLASRRDGALLTARKAATTLDAVTVENSATVAEAARAALPAAVARWESWLAGSGVRGEVAALFDTLRVAERLTVEASGQHRPEFVADAMGAINVIVQRPTNLPTPDDGLAALTHEYRFLAEGSLPPLADTLAEHDAIRASGRRVVTAR